MKINAFFYNLHKKIRTGFIKRQEDREQVDKMVGKATKQKSDTINDPRSRVRRSRIRDLGVF